MLSIPIHFVIAVSLLHTRTGVLAAPQHDMNEMPGSFSLPLQRRLQTESGSTDVTGYTDNTGEYAWLVDVTIRDQTFSLELDTGSETT